MSAALTALAATVQGTVSDPDGKAVPGARVVLSTPLTSAATATTDANGHFSFDSLAAGRYEVHVLIEGFRAAPVSFVLEANESRDVPVTLQVSAFTESVVVSASQVDVPLSRVADSVAVVTERELEARQVESVSDALRSIPGMTVVRSGGRGGLTAVFPRGGESDFTLVLVDGMRANDFGGGFDFSMLPLASVEQVEIVRGPQSALHGSDAIGGVVQIVTRRGGRPRAGALFEGGGMDTTRVAATTAGSVNRWIWGGAFDRLATDGFTGIAPATGEPVTNDDYEMQEGSGTFGYQASDSFDAQLNVRVYSDERGFPGPYGSNPIGAFTNVDRTSRGKNDGRQVGFRTTFPWSASDRWRQQANVSYSDFDGSFVSPFGDSTSGLNRWTARTVTDVLAWRDTTASFGVEFQNEKADNTFITGASGTMVPVKRRTFGYFGELRAQPSERLSIIGGIRVEHIRRERLEASFDPFSPRPTFDVDTVVSPNPKVTAGYYLSLPSTTGSWTRLRASAGTGIRPPSAFEIAFTDNPGLKPERSRSIEAGVTQAFANGAVMLDLTGFYNHFDDLIVAVGQSQQDASRYQTDNIANARSSGLETGVSWRLACGLMSRATYTWLSTEILAVDGASNEAPSPFVPGDRLIRRPKNQGSLDVTLTRERFNAFLTVEARGQMIDVEPSFGTFGGLFSNPGYGVVHMGGGVRLTSVVEVYGRVMNLFDRQYEEALGFPAIGRTALLGVRVATRR